MIEVVAALVLIMLFPAQWLMGLMLDHDAFSELSVVVAASVPAILGNLESIQLFSNVLFGRECITRVCSDKRK